MIVSEYIRNRNECHITDADFLIWKMSGSIDFSPCFMDGEKETLLTHILIREGSMTVRHKEVDYHIGQGCYAVFMDAFRLEISSVSNNLRAYLMSLTLAYAKTLTQGILPLSASFVLERRQIPMDRLEHHHVGLLWRRMECIWECCMDKHHLFMNEKVKCAFWMWMLDIANIYNRKEESDNKNVKPDRKKELFVEFMMLLPIHVSSEHSLGFYASSLCVTPQYLNRIVRSYSGKTIYEWIGQTLTGMITKRLETTADSMQKLAADFHFPDQSALAKFYKRQTGCSLTEYRKKVGLK